MRMKIEEEIKHSKKKNATKKIPFIGEVNWPGGTKEPVQGHTASHW